VKLVNDALLIYPQVRCISFEGQNLGVISTADAIKMANEKGMDT
jgi:translation initiation factor IF-3